MKTMLLLKNVSLRWILFLFIQHIPEHHYKMIRYYGLYARHRNNDKKLRRAIPKNRQPIIRSLQNGVITSLCPLDMILFLAP